MREPTEAEQFEELRSAVKHFLEEMEKADEEGDRLSWPVELERLSGYVSREERA